MPLSDMLTNELPEVLQEGMYMFWLYLFLTGLTSPHPFPFILVRAIFGTMLFLGLGHDQHVLVLPLVGALEALEYFMKPKQEVKSMLDKPKPKPKPKHKHHTRGGDTFNIQMGFLVEPDSDSDEPESDEQGPAPRPTKHNIAEEPTPDGSDTETESHYEARMNAAAAPRG